MSVSKRVRYEVLRRDNYSCRYCGATAPDAVLTVDHVLPESLGGPGTPDNLVTACRDCNAGKSSATPDAPLVADVRQDAIRWADAMRQAADDVDSAEQPTRKYVAAFDSVWTDYAYGGAMKKQVPRPSNWRSSVETFFRAGLPISLLVDAVDIAMGNSRVNPDGIFRYMCGIAWNRVREIQERALEILGDPQQPEQHHGWAVNSDGVATEMRCPHDTGQSIPAECSTLTSYYCSTCAEDADE